MGDTRPFKRCILLSLRFLYCFTDYAFEFPNKGVADVVHIWGMPSLRQFTVCFWMKSSDSNDGTPFSYAVPATDNELLIAKYNNFAVWVGDEKRQVLLLTAALLLGLCFQSFQVGQLRYYVRFTFYKLIFDPT